ncbi:MAG TPA: cytochrome C oxidase subunit IV family protein [Thermoanaerobaculia bacterium]|nr:cytochrome C oxidase subunit IV family protein [Thermoanaerobaculia bacterium]
MKHAPEHHIASLTMYFGVFIALMVLTVLTVAASRIDIGAWNTPLAMAIAIVKATLVVLFFMHVIQSPRLTWVVVLSSVVWLGVLFVLTFSDYLTRHWLV